MDRKLIVIALGVFMSTHLATTNTIGIVELVRMSNKTLTEKEVKETVDAIYQYSAAFDLDPKLLAAIGAQESKFKPKAIGSKGEIGIYQIRPEYHLLGIKDIEVRAALLYDIDTNTRVAAKYLSALQTLHSDKYTNINYVELYNRGPSSKPKKFPYTKKVLQYYRMLGGEL